MSSAPTNKISRGQPLKKIMSKIHIEAKADLKTARSALTKSETRVRKAITKMNNARVSVDFFVLAVRNAAVAAVEDDDSPVDDVHYAMDDVVADGMTVVADEIDVQSISDDEVITSSAKDLGGTDCLVECVSH